MLTPNPIIPSNPVNPKELDTKIAAKPVPQGFNCNFGIAGLWKLIKLAIKMKSYSSISDYIADQQDADDRQNLERLRKTIHDAAPDAEETISYSMPAFKLNGPLIYFANAKQHYGIYPMPSAMQFFADRLKNYKTSKGAIQLPKSMPLDLKLIRDITAFRVKENLEKPYGKNKKARK